MLGKGLPTWKWYPERENLDLAAACHAFSLSDTESRELVDQLRLQFAEKATIEWQAGFLNIRFSSSVYAEMVVEWAENPKALVEYQQIGPEINEEVRLWPYRWLVSLHEADVLANLPEWKAKEVQNYLPSREEIKMVKQMLQLPGLLQQKGELRRKRTDVMQGLTLIIQQLWKQPILTPLDPAGSAFRQALLRLVLATAKAIGDPLAQSPKDAIGIMD
ncbi:MAG: hypothetical protein RLZZ519_669 [Bacteroidota bacterium]